MAYQRKIDLHGLHVDLALTRIEAIVYKERGIRLEIVHGCGHGILRRAVREFLASCPCAMRVDYGEEINIPGGSGVTIVYTYE